MKRLTIAFLGLLAAAPLANAQQAPAATAAAPKPAAVPGTKIAVMNFRQALVDSEPGVLAAKEYEKQMGPMNTRLEKLQKDILDLQEKIKTAKTDPEKNEFARQIQDKQREGQRVQEDATKQAEELQDKLLPPIGAMVNKALDAYATEKGLAVVLDPTTEPNNIVFANTSMDITTEIMRRVNEEYAKNPKAAAPTATPAAPATAPATRTPPPATPPAAPKD